MMYANKMAQAIALMREHAREQAGKVGAREAHRDLMFAMRTLLEEFRVEFDVPGTRYWLHPESDSYFSTAPGEPVDAMFASEEPIELARHEFLSRQDLHFGYDDRL